MNFKSEFKPACKNYAEKLKKSKYFFSGAIFVDYICCLETDILVGYFQQIKRSGL